MALTDHRRKAKHGFALIVVLAGLAILTSLFAITTNVTMAHLQSNRSNSVLAENMHLNGDILQWVLSAAPPVADKTAPLWREMNGTNVTVHLQDAGGLIDLNTATPDLLDLLVTQMDLPAEALTDYRAWRRTPYRLLRVTDFLRVTGAGPEHRDWLLQVATVYSGRPGVAPDHAPLPVLELITERTGARDTLAKSLPDHLISPASGTNFNVMAEMNSVGGHVLIGTVHITSASKKSRVLWAQ